jgi:hypothetical protein
MLQERLSLFLKTLVMGKIAFHPLEALKISAVFPVTCLAFYAISLSYIVYSFVPPDDVWINPVIHYLGGLLAFGCFTLILSLAIVAMLYGPQCCSFLYQEMLEVNLFC